jgi:hypothetical protein
VQRGRPFRGLYRPPGRSSGRGGDVRAESTAASAASLVDRRQTACLLFAPDPGEFARRCSKIFVNKDRVHLNLVRSVSLEASRLSHIRAHSSFLAPHFCSTLSQVGDDPPSFQSSPVGRP